MEKEKRKVKFKVFKLLFIVLFIGCSLIPFVLMPFFGNQESESGDADASLAPLISKGKLNTGFFTDDSGKFDGKFMEKTGDYFSKKFAFRREMVDIGDRIKADVFGVSGQDGVTIGRDGYIFYSDSFNNFLGRYQLSDYEIYSMAYNLKTVQEMLRKKGIDFLFTISPNKNSLYPDLMPERYDPDVDARNSSRLVPVLEAKGVNYRDLFRLFKNKKEVMYLKGDSHWNNSGAAMVAEDLMDALGREHHSYQNEPFEVRKDFNGDLYRMIYPATKKYDEQIYYDRMEPEEYDKRVTVMIPDPKMHMLGPVATKDAPSWAEEAEIMTEHNENKEGTLLMIRDSFGNSLSPFIADEFKEATFLNNTPYDLGRAISEERDTVIFEIVERNLNRLTAYAPLIPSTCEQLSEKELLNYKSGRFVKQAAERSYDGKLSAKVSDRQIGYIEVTGNVDPSRTKLSSRFELLMQNKETGKRYMFTLFRTRREGSKNEYSESPDREYGVSCYIATEDLPEGDYKMSLIYDGVRKTGTLGTFEYRAE